MRGSPTLGFSTCEIRTMEPDGTGQTNLTNTPLVNAEGFDRVNRGSRFPGWTGTCTSSQF